MSWKFDHSVALNFSSHARQHIPNYEKVIHHCVEICQAFDKDPKIIDVGCAVGETLVALKNAGFNNLYGVDNSQDMLAQCPPIAKLTLSEEFPDEEFDIVLMNWTLHFIKDKIGYLQSIYKNLMPGGVFVVSEKTCNDPYALNFYHNFKSSQGVSKEDIIKKANDVKDIMFINDPLWYLNTLKDIGFEKIFIVDSHWCFTTFVCVKNAV